MDPKTPQRQPPNPADEPATPLHSDMALRTSEEQFRRAIEDAPIPMIMHAEDGEVLQISRSWTELTGYTLADIPTLDAWLTRAYGAGADAVRSHVHDLFAGDQPTLNVAFEIRTHAGEMRHWSFSASPPGTLHDGRRFVVAMAVDITERTRTERALAEQARLLDLSNDAIIVRDVDNRILYWNHGATELYGWSREEAIGQDLHTLLQTEFEAPFAQLIARLHEHDRLEGEVVQVTRDGRRITLLCRWALDRDAAGRPGAILTTYNDITLRKRTEEALRQSDVRQSFLLKLNDALRDLGDPVEVQATASRVLGEQLGSDRAYYGEIDEATQEFVVVRDWHRPGVVSHARRYSLDDWPMPWLNDGKTWVVRDVDVDPAMLDDQREAYRANDIGAAIVVPLIKGGRLVATFVTNQRAARAWTAGEVALVEETAERLGAAVEHARAEVAVRESEAKYRSLFTSLDDGFCIIERVAGEPLDFRYLEANPAFVTHSGVSDVVGKTIRQVVPGEPEEWFAMYDRVLRTREAVRFERELITVGRVLELYAFPITGSSADQLAVIFKDITERKRREANRDLLVTISERLSRLSNEEEIIRTVGTHLAAHLQLDCYHYVDVDEERAEVTLRAFWHTLEVPDILGTYPIDSFIPPGGLKQLRTGAISVVNDAQNDLPDDSPAVAGMKAGAAAQRIGAYVAVPHSQDGRWKAYFAVADSCPRRWTSFDIELIQEVAGYTFPRIERVRAEAALRTSEERYRTLFDTMAEGFTICGALHDAAGWVVDLRYLEVNRALEQQTGLDSRALLGRKLSEVLPRADVERWLSIYAGALDSGEPVAFEEYVALLDRWFAVSVYPRTRDELAVFYRDITERKHHEQRQVFLLKLSDTLRAEPDADAVANRALQMLSEQLQLDRCYIGIYRLADDRGDFPHQVGNDRVPPLPDGVRLSDFPAALRVAFGQTLVIDDVAETDGLSDTDRRNLSALGLSALVVATLRRGENNLLWSIVAVSATPRHWTRGEVALVEEVTERTWVAMEHARAEAALRESEGRLRALADNLPGGAAFIVDRELRYQLAKGEALHAAGFVPRDYLGKTIFEALPPELAGSYEPLYRQALAGEAFMHEHAAHGRTYISRGTPLYTLSGEVYAVLVVSYDISDRKRAEEAVRESEARFRTLADTVPQLIWTNNAAGKAIYFNQRWYAYSGLSEEQSIGPGWQAIVHPDDEAGSVQHWQEALSRGDVFESEYRLRRADGSYRWNLGRTVPLRNQGGQVIGWFGSATDVEALKQAEAARHESALLRRLAEAQEEERLRIARDLHDQLGQLITGLLLQLKQLEGPARGTAVAPLLPPVEALATDMAKEAHRIAVNLRPTALEDVGLVLALERLTADWSRQAGVPAAFMSVGMERERLPR